MAETISDVRNKILDVDSYEHRNKDVLFVKRIIKNNLLTIPVAIVLYTFFTTYYMYEIFRLAYDTAFSTNVNTYYYRVSGAYPDFIAGSLEIILNSITGYMIKFVRMVLLIMFICIFIYLCCYAVINVFIQHEIKIPYVIITNILALLITISIVYYIMPSTTDLIISFATYLQGAVVDFQQGTYVDMPKHFTELFKVMIRPMIVAIVLMFILTSAIQILLKYVKKW